MKKQLLFPLIVVLGFMLGLSPAKVSAADENTVEHLIGNDFHGGGVAQGWKDDDEYWSYDLPFSFNFYGVDYTTVYVSTNGFVGFTEDDMSDYDFPVNTYDGTPFIVAMGGDQDTSYEEDDDIYITSTSDHVIFRWQAQEHSAEVETALNFEIVLYKNGNFELNYGDNTISGEDDVYVGMSDGISKSTFSAYNEISDYNQLQTSFWGDVVEDNEEEEDEAEKAKIDSWEASMMTDKSSCSEKLQLEIKGHKFDNDAVVKIGGQEASWVDVKSSQKIVARFCMEKLMKAKLSSKRDIRVTNPDADSAKAKKKIDLDNIVGAIDENMFNQGTREGVMNIQKALVKLGYLDKENVTGAYGPLTTEAVKKFQGDNGISQTGNVGPLTQAALQKKLK